ncbi:hypothetical protein MGN70_005612 [Eutypa lata]|nr:hypothetical protein MGN70_005612 [Eutypa lata]
MDYHSIHGQDISSFDLTSTHRLPTVSAAQALEEISTDPRRFISTGIRALDKALVSVQNDDVNASSSGLGGFQRGQVAEIWGPPGSGKTALGMQLTANVLKTGNKAIWGLGRQTGDYRNWAIRHEKYQSAHFAGIQKLDGRSMPRVIGPIFAFDIQPGGLVEIETDRSQSSLILSTISHHKRKLGETDFELADSEDEDYGWEDEDAAEIPSVPQWQGSEDILLGHPDDDGNQSGGNSDSHPQSPEVSPR